MALIYQVNQKNIFKLLYGRAGKSPSIETIGDDFLDNIDGFKTNEYSNSEYITTYELNYTGKFTKNLILKTNLFYNQLNNLLIEKSFRYDLNIVRVLWTNRGKMYTTGIESTVTGKFFRGTQFEISAVYQHSYDKALKTRSSYAPHWLGYLKIYHPLNNFFSLAVSGNFVDAMKPHFNTTLKTDSDGVITDEYIGRTAEDVKKYVTIDLHANASFPIGNTKVFAGLTIQNLLNSEVRYPTFSINNDWADRGTFGYFRTFNISAGIRF